MTISFYRQDGGLQCTASASNVAPRATYVFFPTCGGNNFLGSAVVTANQPLVGMGSEARSDLRFAMAYSSFQGGTRTAYGPLVFRAYAFGGYTWDSGIAVQNLSTSASANITLTYYNSSGSLAGTQSATLNPRGMQAFFAPVLGLKGSVKI
ncbi:MAG TPA: hypothetical protein VGJ72_20530, partial [Polaromonas sp.]